MLFRSGERARFTLFAVAVVGQRVPGLDHHVVNPFPLTVGQIIIVTVLSAPRPDETQTGWGCT